MERLQKILHEKMGIHHMTRATCIIPVYKVERYFQELLDSIQDTMEHSGTAMNFVFVNDASPENEEEVLRDFAAYFNLATIHILRHDVNRGLAASRNTGIEYSLAHLVQDYVMWMDSDDILSDIDGRVDFMKAHPEVDYGYASYFTFRGTYERTMSFGDPFLQEFNYMDLFRENTFSSCGGIIKAEKLRDIRFEESYRICEDYDFNLRAGLKMKIAKIPESVSRAFMYRLRDKGDLSLSFDPSEQKYHFSNNSRMKRAILKYVRTHTIDPEIAAYNKINLELLRGM